ncbi:hypothetical protein C1J03_15560 [Sulfitobacter sp. SK012]|nr:hypothetical protein C1J03_15560 [Sulfitobacter sp. SK012]
MNSGNKTTICELVDLYLARQNKEIRKTKTQVLRSIKLPNVAAIDVTSLTTNSIVDFARFDATLG